MLLSKESLKCLFALALQALEHLAARVRGSLELREPKPEVLTICCNVLAYSVGELIPAV